jgi:CDP-paratose 2-epimerase
VIEALNIVEELIGNKIKRKLIKTSRVGDHIWYISNMKRFKKDYPKWKQEYSIKGIIKELVEKFSL